jgi:diguanylate cyclase (GGDEF)-like protein
MELPLNHRDHERRHGLERRRLAQRSHDLSRAPSWPEQRSQFITRYLFVILGVIYYNIGTDQGALLAQPMAVNAGLILYAMLVTVCWLHARQTLYSPLRWRAAMWIDLVGITLTMYIDPAVPSPSMLLYLTVIFGNGMRYGTLYLAETVIGSFFLALMVFAVRYQDVMQSLTLSGAFFMLFSAILVVYAYALTRGLERARRQLEVERSLDMLTGLLNRRALFERAEKLFRANHFNEHPLVVIFADLDRFKAVNDRLGHHVGDRVLSEIARLLAGTLRSTDLVGRFGGDEFVVILPATDLDTGAQVAQRLQDLVTQWSARNDVDVSVSIGLGQAPLHGKDLASLIERVDKAMYQSKLAFGRGGILRVEQALPA